MQQIIINNFYIVNFSWKKILAKTVDHNGMVLNIVPAIESCKYERVWEYKKNAINDNRVLMISFFRAALL